MARVLVILILLTLPACTWRDAQGEHTLVLGFGVVTHQTDLSAQPQAIATQLRATGALISPQGLLIGALARHELRIAPGADLTLEAWTDQRDQFHVISRPSRGVCRSGPIAFHGGDVCELETSDSP